MGARDDHERPFLTFTDIKDKDFHAVIKPEILRGDEVRLAALSEDLRAKTYRLHSLRRVYIPKSGGGRRP